MPETRSNNFMKIPFFKVMTLRLSIIASRRFESTYSPRLRGYGRPHSYHNFMLAATVHMFCQD